MATLVTISLSACDSGPGKSTADAQVESEAIVQQIPNTGTDAPRVRPHSSYDPHASLTPDKHVQVALQHLAEGRATQAIDSLNQAVEMYPDNANLHGVRGSLLLEQGRSSAALADLNRALELDAHNPMFLTNRAQAYRNFGRIDEAMADLDKAIETDSGFIAARFNRGSLAFNAGRYPQALEDFDACVAADPHSAAPYFNRASVHDVMGNRALAIADLKRFLEIAPSEEWKDAAKALLQRWQAEDVPANKADLS